MHQLTYVFRKGFKWKKIVIIRQQHGNNTHDKTSWGKKEKKEKKRKKL